MATPNYSPVALANWQHHPFYAEALVLGIDIGLSYIGLYLRLGREDLAGETVVWSARDPLEPRRLKRHWRRNRRAQNQRIFQFRGWCARFGLPWFPLSEWQQRMEPAFRLRLQGEEHPGSLSAGELVVSLRHILMRRGYDWHRIATAEKTYPWGDANPMTAQCRQWIEANYIDESIRQRLLEMVPDGDEAENKLRADMDALLAAAVTRSAGDNILTNLRQHAAHPFALRARGKNYPRDLVEQHAQNILRQQAHLLPDGKLEAAIAAYLEILNHHRKDEVAQMRHWESKAGPCPFTGEQRAKASDPEVKRFRLLEFLATRRFAITTRRRSPLPPTLQLTPPEVIAWLLEHPAGQAEPLPRRGELREAFQQRVCPEGIKLAADAKTLNGDFFSQLRDLLYPRPASAGQRAALSSRAAREWFNFATAEGKTFAPTDIVTTLRTKLGPGNYRFYERRREAVLAEWFHPHVEFLLGPRAFLLNGRQPPHGQIHGWLNRMLARPDIAKKLQVAGHSGKPDYVVIEVAGDIPRTSAGRAKIEAEQKERRKIREAMIERYHLAKGDENALLRAALWEQQGGTEKSPARCPLRGDELTGGPLNPNLELAHIYPQAWGGPFQRDNLFLTLRTTNEAMGDLPPARCAGFNDAHLTAMRWPARKRELFTTPWKPNDRPDWGMDTRVAQLARQLRDAMKVWLGITDENEFAARVGTVTGYFTAQCRKAWLEGYRKDRSDLRNHLYDAMVLTHIPPGVGLNSAAHGGIFVTQSVRQPDGSEIVSYRPLAALGPDWQAYDHQHRDDCLVVRPKSSASKKSRFDDSIYGIAKSVRHNKAGKAEPAPRLQIREVITKGGWPVDEAESWLAAAAQKWPSFAQCFPEARWREWLEENTRRQHENDRRKRAKSGEPLLEPFPLVSSLHNAQVRGLKTDAKKPSFFDPFTLAPHESRGAKNPVERNVAIEIYVFQNASGRTTICSRTLLHPRLVAMREKWRLLGEEVPPPAPLPNGAKLLARVTKADLLCLPLRKDGELADKMSDAYVRVWYQVSALKTSGQVEMKPAEFNVKELKTTEDGTVARPGSRLFGLRLKPVFKAQNESLLKVLRLNNRAFPE